MDIIYVRENRILDGCKGSPWEKLIVRFLNKEFRPIASRIIKKFLQNTSKNNMSLELPYTWKELIFSPSDFGFHNILKDDSGILFFFDFEYSGWDDSAKLLADFFHHPGQEISWEYKWELLDRIAVRRKKDPNFLNRWSTVIDLIGLEWVLIILNISLH